MNRIEEWLIKNEFFSKLSLALSAICFVLVAILPIDNNSVPLIICIWLIYSIFNEFIDHKNADEFL